jgi:hypothetical protein
MNPISSYCYIPQNHVLERKQKRERILKSEEETMAAAMVLTIPERCSCKEWY